MCKAIGVKKSLLSMFCAGDFASAIETLVTAVSLIKQSKIANDDRCKILISSLQDTLHGIEEKSYGSKLVLIAVYTHNRMAQEILFLIFQPIPIL